MGSLYAFRLEELHQCAGASRHRWADPADAARCCNGFVRRLEFTRDATGDPVVTFSWVRGEDGWEEKRDADGEDPAYFPYPASDWHDGVAPFWPEPAHTPFVQALEMFDRRTLEWRETLAGYEAMRVIDRWARRHFIRRSPSFTELAPLRCQIDELPSGVVQRILAALVTAVMYDAPMRMPSVWALLAAYGGILERTRQPALAADVFGTAIEHARTREEQLQAPEYYYRMGLCLRRIGRYNAAMSAHREGRRLAERLGAPEHALLNRIGKAAVLLATGNVPGSDRRYADVARDAEVAGLPDVRATALHERALATYARRRPGGDEAPHAIVWLHEAFRGYSDAARRDRALDDMATAFLYLRLPKVARDIYRYVYATADDPDIQLAAGLKGLKLSAACGEDRWFRHYAKTIAREQLESEQLADYFLNLGLGHWRAGRVSRARSAFTRAIALSEDYQFYQVMHDAEQSRARLDDGVEPPPVLRSTGKIPTPAVGRVIRALRALVSAELTSRVV